jgi:hypothetical protein
MGRSGALMGRNGGWCRVGANSVSLLITRSGGVMNGCVFKALRVRSAAGQRLSRRPAVWPFSRRRARLCPLPLEMLTPVSCLTRPWPAYETIRRYDELAQAVQIVSGADAGCVMDGD